MNLLDDKSCPRVRVKQSHSPEGLRSGSGPGSGCGGSDSAGPRSSGGSRTLSRRTDSQTGGGRLCWGLKGTQTPVKTNKQTAPSFLSPRALCDSLTAQEASCAGAGLHAVPGFLRGGHGALQAGDKGGAGVQVPADPVLGVNDGGLRRSTAHFCLRVKNQSSIGEKVRVYLRVSWRMESPPLLPLLPGLTPTHPPILYRNMTFRG